MNNTSKENSILRGFWLLILPVVIFSCLFFSLGYLFLKNVLYLFDNLQDVVSYLATQSWGQSIRIGKVRFDFFKGEISLRDIEAEGTNPSLPPLVVMDRLSLKMDLASLLRGKDFSQSIKRVEIGRLEFNLFCDEKGCWNFPRPKPAKPPTGVPPSFPIEIRDINGRVRDSFYSKQEWEIRGRGKILLHRGTTDFLIQGGINGSPFIIRGENNQERFKVNLALKSLRFSLLQARGVISASLILQKAKDKLLWEAQARLRNASITHKKLPIKVMNCSLDFLGNQDVCRVSGFHLSTDKGVSLREGEAIFVLHKPYTVAGEAIFEGKASSFLACVGSIIKRGESLKRIGDFPLRGEVKVIGKLSKPVVEANVAISRASYRGLAISDSKVSIRYFKNSLEVREGETHLLGGKIRYKGFGDLKSREYVFQGEAKNINFEGLPNNIKEGLKRALQLKEFPKGELRNATIWGERKEGKAPSFEIEAQFSKLKYVKVFEEKLYIKLGYENDKVAIEKLEGEDEKGVFAFRGSVDIKGRGIEGDVEGMDINVEKIAPLWGVKRSKGFVYLRGKVNGTLANPGFQIGIEAFDIGYRNHYMDYLSCQIEGRGEKLGISRLNFTKGIGKGKAEGEIDLSRKTVSLQGEFSNLPLDQILPRQVVSTGIGEGNFLLRGSLYSPRLEVQGKVGDLLVKDNYVKAVSAVLRWEKDRGVIEGGRAFLKEGEINFAGEFGERDVSLYLEGKGLNLGEFSFSPEGMGGYSDLRGWLKGPFNSPSFEGELKGKVVYNGERGELSAKLFVDRNHIEGKGISFIIGEGNLSAFVSYSFKEGSIAGYLRGDNLPLAILERLSRLPPEFRGKLSSTLTISGTRTIPRLRGMFRCEGLENRYLDLSLLEGKYSLEGKRLQLEDIKGEKEDFSLGGKAELNLSTKDFSLSFKANNLPLSIFASYLPQLQPEGKGDLTISGKGHPASPFLSLAFNSPQARLNGVGVENLNLSAEWDGEKLKLKEITLQRDGKEVRGEAELPFGIKEGFGEDKPWYISFRWEKQDIGWLKSFMPSLEEFGGEVRGEIRVRGTYNNPDTSGFVNFERCYAKPKGFEESLKNANAKFVLQGNKAVLDGVSFQLGRGRGELKGNIYMTRQGLRLETLASLTNVSLKEHNISGYGESLQGELNGLLSITGGVKSPLLVGALSLSNAKLDLSSYVPPKVTKEAPQARKFNPAFLLTVGLGNNCWFISSGSRVLTEGRLSLLGSLNNPRLQGHFSSRYGMVFISNYIFRLREGAADVVYGGNVLNLNVFARAETTLRGYKITANINGPYDNLQLRFTSSPPLPQNAILAMFVPKEFAENPEQFFKSELANAFAVGLGTKILAPLEFALAEITGLEEISLEYGVEGYPVLRLKQEILPKTYIVYSRWLTTPQERYLFGIERNIGGDIYLTFSTDELKRKIWGIEGTLRF